MADLIERFRKRRGTNLLTDIRVKKVDLVGIPAIGRGITLFKARDHDERNALEELQAAVEALPDDEKAEFIRAVAEKEAEHNTQVLEKEHGDMTASKIPLAKAYLGEIDARGELQKEEIKKSQGGTTTLAALALPRFYSMMRKVRQQDPKIKEDEAFDIVRKDEGIGQMVFNLACHSLQDYEADWALAEIEKANPQHLDRLALHIMKAAY